MPSEIMPQGNITRLAFAGQEPASRTKEGELGGNSLIF
jgi:hypothetical protein